ncbi:MAG: hypothetical protein ACR2P5_08820 [Gammaproteobacteria bacterium]
MNDGYVKKGAGYRDSLRDIVRIRAFEGGAIYKGCDKSGNLLLTHVIPAQAGIQ